MKKKDFFTKFSASQPEELQVEITKLKQELGQKSSKLATNQKTNTASLRQIRRQIAWLSTLKTSHKLANTNQAKKSHNKPKEKEAK